ncbi:hypothetical protein LMG7974_00998 [Campylobacter majalis]|uniref:Isochorismatase-like domain-containing protein n=1 Tax=Campylobacter majalis TaxID=2790656 RepID=A0ABN7KBL0_9BACT|nr:cysteine hydrolase family protein [Campylobacter majalis]CAD7288415.1 hypothetical protein LMG7974_00998 [Campylobacter majalis]
MKDTALVIIDIQNDYFQGGKSELYEPIKAAQNAKALLEKFRQLNAPIFHIQHIFESENAPFFAPNTNGVQIHELLTPKDGEFVVVKHFPDAFLNTKLGHELERLNIKNLIICGMMSHMCIDTSVRSAVAKGFSVSLAHDACATKELEFNGTKIDANIAHIAFMAAMNGIFADVKTTDEILKSL